MQVGLVIYGNLNTLSGGYLYDRKLVEALRSAGDRVEIVSFPWVSYPRCLIQNLAPVLARQIAGQRVDLWLQDELNHPSLFWMNRMLHRKVHAPVLSIVHHLRSSEVHPDKLLRLYRQVELAYLRSVDGFIFNSQVTRRSVESLMGAIVSGVVATPGGDRLGGRMSAAEVEQRSRQAGPLRLLFVGSLIRRKGLHDLIAALAALKAEDWVLEVVGRSDVEPETTRAVRQQVRRAGLEGRVIFRGNLSEEKLLKTWRGSQVLVGVSSYEGFGIAYLEGMGFGLPAIASKAGGAIEVIENKKNGWLVAPGDVTAISNVVKGYCRNRKLLAAHSQAALARFELFPTWKQSTQTIREYLLGIVESRARS
jgi:glycosyltransferase involved in cell wall biosynthesis